MIFRFFPKFFPQEFSFFDLFAKQVGYAVEAALCFKEWASNGADEAMLRKIETIEHQADEVAHTIIGQLDKTFITPFDREDIYTLVKEMDDITDMINTIMSRMTVYKLTDVNETLVEFSSVIEQSVLCVERAVKGLRKPKKSKLVLDSCVEINRLENVGDTMRDEALAKLFEEEKNPIAIIKWKEIYQYAETVLDICEDVANVVESIIVKQA
jgi:hypothetical protein